MRMVVQNVFARDGRRILSRSEGKRTNPGKGVADVCLGQAGTREEAHKALEEVINLLLAGLRIVRIVGVRYFAGANKKLAVPRNQKDWAAVHGLRVDRLVRSAL